MEVTRRYWATAGLGGLLAVTAVLLGRPLPLLGAGSIGAWLLAAQYWFVRRAAETVDELTVTQLPSRTRLRTDDRTHVTLEAVLPRPAAVAIDIDPATPVSATAASKAASTATIRPDEREAETAFVLEWPIAGKFRIDPPAVAMTDPWGLFRTSVHAGSSPTVTVEPNRPDDVHVGIRGTRYGTPYGEVKTGETGTGGDLAEIREYVMADPASRIDWKTTARMNRPYVREYETEVDVTTALVVDHRKSLATGRAGRTKFDYLRQVALAFAAEREVREPLGLYAVDDEGLTVRQPPDATIERYATIRTRLHDLAPVRTATDRSEPRSQSRPRSPSDARRTAGRLRTDETEFGGSLEPFFSSTRTYVERIKTDPLYRTVRHLSPATDSALTVLFTDDSNRREVREAVKLARQGDDRVVAFLAPTVLFELDGLTDVEAAYDRYVDFDSFRREIGGFDRATAFEVAPGDRIEALLAARGQRTTEKSRL